MRASTVLTLSLLVALSGCTTRWVVFGHSMGGPPESAPSTPVEAPPVEAPAPVDAPAPAGQTTAPTAEPANPAPPAAAGQSTNSPQRASATQSTNSAQSAGASISEDSAPSPPPTHTTRRAAATGSLKIRAVNITYTAAAKEQIATEPQFTAGGLSAAIEAELRAQRLLDDSAPAGGDTIGIMIDRFNTQAMSNAVVFGRVFTTGTLEGNLELQAADGRELRSSRIRVKSHLSKPAGDTPADFFEPLYRGFAGLTARKLTGAPEPVSVNH